MKFVVLIISMSVGFVLSFHGKYQNQLRDDIAVNSEDVNEAVHQLFKKSISTRKADFDNLVNVEGTVQEPCRLTLPTQELSDIEFPLDLYRDDDIQDYQPTEVMPPRVPHTPRIPLNNWTPYDFDYLAQEPAHYGAPYNSYMPYIYSNPVPSVRSLPPVISTHIHETVPETPEIDYRLDMNGLPDSDYFAPYVRVVRSRDEEFIEQLEKDAMMPNLLPTMPFPYMRSAQQNYQTQYGESGNMPVASFPEVGEDCALPFLVSCSPKIFYGTLMQKGYSANPLAAYRKDSAIEPSHVKAL